MFHTLKRQAQRLTAASLAAVSLLAVAGAVDVPQTTALLTSNLSSTVGTVLTSDEIMTAEQALAKAKAEAEAKAKAEAEAKAKAEAEAAAKAAAEQAYNALMSDPVASKTVSYSSSLLASDLVKSNATALGNYKLTFYCPCATCNGNSHSITASGTYLTEGRTIAVDPRVIPLGSRVYIDGYGVFIAEDTGGAIKSNKIDVLVSSHARCYELGVQYANVYLLD